jgi:hypothetical protein
VTGDPSTFHHVACTYDADQLRVYFDGELAGTADVTNGWTDATNDNPLTFGSQYPRGPTPGIDNSRGYLDEVAVFGRALALDEIAQMYENGLAGRGYCAAPVLLSVHFYHPEVSGCIKMQGTVRLAEPAPAGGLTVALHSDNEHAVVPASVVVKEGALMKRFQILTSPVAVREAATITASVPGQEVSATLGVKPMVLKDLVLSPNPVVGGNPAVGTMTLQCPAGPGDIEVTLASKNPSVANPTVSHITIPFGTQEMTPDLTTTPVTRVYTPAISATANGVKRSRPLTVTPVP